MIVQRGEFYTKQKAKVTRTTLGELGFLPNSKAKTKEEIKKERIIKMCRESPRLFYTPEECNFKEEAVIELHFWNTELKSLDSLTDNRISKLIYEKVYLKGCQHDYIYVMPGMQDKLSKLYFN